MARTPPSGRNIDPKTRDYVENTLLAERARLDRESQNRKNAVNVLRADFDALLERVTDLETAASTPEDSTILTKRQFRDIGRRLGLL